jgi:hypothetical protein
MEEDTSDVIADLFSNWVQRFQTLIDQLEGYDEGGEEIASDDPEVMERICRWLSDSDNVRKISEKPACWKALGDLIAVFAIKEQN